MDISVEKNEESDEPMHSDDAPQEFNAHLMTIEELKKVSAVWKTCMLERCDLCGGKGH